jgi:hypothetical protein
MTQNTGELKKKGATSVTRLPTNRIWQLLLLVGMSF